MDEEVYYQRRFFNKDLGKNITYFYNYRRLTRRAPRIPLVFGLSSGDNEVRSFLLTFIIVLITYLIVAFPFMALFTLLSIKLGLYQYRIIEGLIEWTIVLVFFFISYAIVVPRFINLKFFRKIMDIILLGRLKKKGG